MSEPRIRSVHRIVVAQETADGAGVELRRVFPTPGIADVDPFLLLDHLGPTDYGPGEMAGFPDHPHRGFETVTYVLEGKFEHRDSQGNHGILGPGDVQWMTAGAGVVHSEMPEESFARDGGRFQGFQLWVNLPKKDKMIAPRYQDVPSKRIPVVTTPDGLVRVKLIAGEALGARATIDTRIPIVFQHVTLSPGGRYVASVPQDEAAFVYVLEGEVETGGRKVIGHRAAHLAQDGDSVELSSAKGADLLLIAGKPLREPVARYGPFVMNTEAEIRQAIDDFRAGKLGSIPARVG